MGLEMIVFIIVFGSITLGSLISIVYIIINSIRQKIIFKKGVFK